VTGIVDNCLKGKLKIEDFPSTQQGFNPKNQMEIVIVFILGGATYEEEKEVSTVFNNAGKVSVILGGNTIHNSKSFMADITKLQMGGL
jgi:hypothetical protein